MLAARIRWRAKLMWLALTGPTEKQNRLSMEAARKKATEKFNAEYARGYLRGWNECNDAWINACRGERPAEQIH